MTQELVTASVCATVHVFTSPPQTCSVMLELGLRKPLPALPAVPYQALLPTGAMGGRLTVRRRKKELTPSCSCDCHPTSLLRTSSGTSFLQQRLTPLRQFFQHPDPAASASPLRPVSLHWEVPADSTPGWAPAPPCNEVTVIATLFLPFQGW